MGISHFRRNFSVYFSNTVKSISSRGAIIHPISYFYPLVWGQTVKAAWSPSSQHLVFPYSQLNEQINLQKRAMLGKNHLV